MRQDLQLRRFVSDTVLPAFSRACSEAAPTLDFYTRHLTALWPLPDRVLVMLEPNLSPDVANFHAIGGPSLGELLRSHQLAHLDESLCAALVSFLQERSRETVSDSRVADPAPLRRSPVRSIQAVWHNSLCALAFVLPPRLASETGQILQGPLRKSITLLLNPASQRRVIRAVTAIAHVDVVSYDLFQSELEAVAACWRDVTALPNGQLLDRAEATLLLHALRTFRLSTLSQLELLTADRRAIRALHTALAAAARDIADT